MKIVFFDGFCILCNKFHIFLRKHDKKQVLFFSTLQGKTAKKSGGFNTTSIVYKKESQIFRKSDAVLQILLDINKLVFLSKVARIFPKRFRDWLYDIIANHRYDWFGKRASCVLPSKKEKRFLP